MALDTEHLGIPEQPYDAMIGMNSNEFQRIVRDLYSLSESGMFDTHVMPPPSSKYFSQLGAYKV